MPVVPEVIEQILLFPPDALLVLTLAEIGHAGAGDGAHILVESDGSSLWQIECDRFAILPQPDVVAFFHGVADEGAVMQLFSDRREVGFHDARVGMRQDKRVGRES